MKGAKWKIIIEDISKKTEYGVDEIVNILLENRGIKTKKEKEEFLNPKLESINFENAGIDRKEVDKTLKRVEQAIKNNEKIIIFGDYDVDGICGTAILWEGLFEIHKNVMPHIPHRVDEGYGLSVNGIESVLNEHPDVKLIITVDNGIVANKAVEYAKEKAIDVIITDHHVASDKKPKAHSIVHTTKLCGAGVAYLLSKEIALIHNSEFINQNYLELVALATVADLVPLIGPNRAVVKFGIEALKKTKRPGLLALYKEAQIHKDKISTYEIGHIIAPRLNASGRITHALDSLRLICTKDSARAAKLANELSATNRDRQAFTQEATLHANELTDKITAEQKFIFVGSENYNQGVIGLVASRLVEKHYKPAVAVSIGEKYSKGSARSIAGFNIIEFLRLHEALLVDVGGHPMAAGFTVETNRIEELKIALAEASVRLIPEEILTRSLTVDMELSFANINFNLYQAIQGLSPFGMGNFEPVFVTNGATVENLAFVGRDRKHLKLKLSQGKKVLDAILFSAENYPEVKVGDNINIAYIIDEDNWNGNEKIQLKVRDVKNS